MGWGFVRGTNSMVIICSSSNGVIYLWPLNWRWFDGWSGQFSGPWIKTKKIVDYEFLWFLKDSIGF